MKVKEKFKNEKIKEKEIGKVFQNIHKDKRDKREMYFIISTEVQKNILLILTPQNYKSQFEQFISQHQDHLSEYEIELIKKEIQDKIRQLVEQIKRQNLSNRNSKIKNNESSSLIQDDHHHKNENQQNQKQKDKLQQIVVNNNNNNGVKSPHFKSIQEEEMDMMESSIEKVEISCSSYSGGDSQNQKQFQNQNQESYENDQNQNDQQNQRIFQESYERSKTSKKNATQNQNQNINNKHQKNENIFLGSLSKELLNVKKNHKVKKIPFQSQQKKDYSKYSKESKEFDEKDLTQTKETNTKKYSNQYELIQQEKTKNKSKKQKIDEQLQEGSLKDNIISPYKGKKKCLLLENYAKGYQFSMPTNSNDNTPKQVSKSYQTPKKVNQLIKKTVSKNISPKNKYLFNQQTSYKDKSKSPKEKPLYSQKQLTHHMFFRLNQEQWHTSSFRNKSKQQFDYKKSQQMKQITEIEQYKQQKKKQINLKYNSEVFNKLYQTQTQSSFNRNNRSKSKQFQEDSIQKKALFKKNNHSNSTFVSKALVEDKKTCRYRCQKEIIQKERQKKEIQRKSRQKQIRKHIKSRSQQNFNNKCLSQSRSGQCQCCNFQKIQQRQLSKEKVQRQKQRLQKQKRQKRRLYLIKKQQEKHKKKPNHTSHQYISNILSQSYQELFQDYHQNLN